MIASKLIGELEIIKKETDCGNKESRQNDGSKITDSININGGADGTRTRDLQRDRLAF